MVLHRQERLALLLSLRVILFVLMLSTLRVILAVSSSACRFNGHLQTHPAPCWRGLLSGGVADQGSLVGRDRILGRRAEWL